MSSEDELYRPIEDIEGIGEVYGARLRSLGITMVADLLKAGATRSGRERLARDLGVTPQRVLEWVNRADLFRVPGVAEEYSDLLEAAGVDTVVELARRNPDHLYQRLVEVNEEKKLVRRLPTREEVAAWVEAAGRLERVVEY